MIMIGNTYGGDMLLMSLKMAIRLETKLKHKKISNKSLIVYINSKKKQPV
jgi:hypothetical protein